MVSASACAPVRAGRSLAAGARRAGRVSAPRLTRGDDIRRVLREGSSRRSRRVVLYVAPGAGPPRAACVTGRRVGGAVARNRARRLLREAWRTLWTRVEGDRDLVLVARGPFGRATAHDVTEEIEDLLAEAHLIRP